MFNDYAYPCSHWQMCQQEGNPTSSTFSPFFQFIIISSVQPPCENHNCSYHTCALSSLSSRNNNNHNRHSSVPQVIILFLSCTPIHHAQFLLLYSLVIPSNCALQHIFQTNDVSIFHHPKPPSLLIATSLFKRWPLKHASLNTQRNTILYLHVYTRTQMFALIQTVFDSNL